MENEKLVNIINNKLIDYGMPLFETLKPNIQQYLLCIENEIQTIIEKKNEALETYKRVKISTNSLVKRINIARQTLYNNGIVDYIIKRQEEFHKEDIYNKIADKNKDINELSEILKKMEIRDLNEQMFLDKIQTLETENKNLSLQIDLINKKNLDLKIQMNGLQIKHGNNTVVDLNKELN